MGKRRFWASVWGDESTEAGRGGSRSIISHTRGWDSGIKVRGHINSHGRDEFEIYLTGGSHDDIDIRLIAIVDGYEITEVACL